MRVGALSAAGFPHPTAPTFPGSFLGQPLGQSLRLRGRVGTMQQAPAPPAKTSGVCKTL